MSYKRDMGSPHACMVRIDMSRYEGKLLNTPRGVHVKTVLVCQKQSYLTVVLFTI